jgi:tetratricopeptide (TPR) repeat protein
MTIDENRRQKSLARKRKGPPGRRSLRPPGAGLSAAQAAGLPIHACLVASELFKTGLGMTFLARALPSGELAVASFLVDVWCLGVKNAFHRVVSPEEWAQLVQRFSFEKTDPACLRKLVEGAVDYARDLGFAPHPDYAGAARLFGSIEAAACPLRYTYGKEGKPVYLSGPDDTPAQSRSILETLARRLGAKGAHCLATGHTLLEGLGGRISQPVALYSYEITDEPLPAAAFDRLPEEVQARINALYEAVLKPRPRQALADVRALIAQYPEIPQLHNYLYAARYNLGEHAEATRVIQETVRCFPDYLFGRIAWAEECLRRREPAKIAEIFAGKFDLRLLYPHRVRFHRTEVLGFHSIVARYFLALGNREQAQRSYDLMCQVDASDPSSRLVGRLLNPSRLAAWLRKKLLPH